MGTHDGTRGGNTGWEHVRDHMMEHVMECVVVGHVVRPCTGAHGGAKLPTALTSIHTKGFPGFQTSPSDQSLSDGVALLSIS